jgi:hypothetical protein
MKNSIFILMMTTIASGVVQAATWPSSTLNCKQDIKGISLPSGVNQDALVKALHPESLKKTATEAELVCLAGVKEWKAASQQIAVLLTQNFTKVERTGGADSHEAHLYLAIVEVPSLKVVEKLTAPITLETADEFQALDTAAYKMAENHFAFGLRTQQVDSLAGGGNVYKYLRLYHVKGQDLKLILGPLLMQSTSDMAGDWHEDGTRDHDTSNSGVATIKILKTKTQGMFDLERTKADKSKDQFQWDGSVYSTDDETVKDSN